MERALSKKEKQLLANANLTPKAEKVIAEAWGKENEPAESGIISTISSYIIGTLTVPLLIFILGANIFHWALVPEGLENIAFIVIWAIFVLASPIFSLLQYFDVDDKKFSSVFSHQSIKILVGGNVVQRYFNRIALLSLLVLIAFRGEIFTAIVSLIGWAVALLFNAALKGKIRIAAKKLG